MIRIRREVDFYLSQIDFMLQFCLTNCLLRCSHQFTVRPGSSLAPEKASGLSAVRVSSRQASVPIGVVLLVRPGVSSFLRLSRFRQLFRPHVGRHLRGELLIATGSCGICRGDLPLLKPRVGASSATTCLWTSSLTFSMAATPRCNQSSADHWLQTAQLSRCMRYMYRRPQSWDGSVTGGNNFFLQK